MTDEIIRSLEPMIQDAERLGMMIQHSGWHDEIRFTPDQLRAQLTRGKYVWGLNNWYLSEPTIAESHQMLLNELQEIK